MALISLQGTALTRTERERLRQQQAVRSSFLNPVLAQSLQEPLARSERFWSEENSRFNILVVSKQFTVSVAEWMGY